VLRGLSAWQIDFSLHREFRLSEGLSLQFRGPGFGSANETLANGLGPGNVLGQLSSVFQIGGPRSMQFALRLRF
jgi:hypothetical protein